MRRGFAPLCPDLLVELASPGDEGVRGMGALRQKMGAYRAAYQIATNGCLRGVGAMISILIESFPVLARSPVTASFTTREFSNAWV